jgi:NAD(P)-dependent dehydrogenase (short-subunit alcohol dehydrogenase family)
MASEGNQRIVVVTGGASGIGEACCEVLARDGWRIVVVDVRADAAEKVANRLGGHAYVVDVGQATQLTELAGTIERELGPVHGLVNSAGIVQHPLPPEELTMEAWDNVINVDQRGTYVACAAFGRFMAARGAGNIVNIASITGMRSVPLHAYAPAKAAVISMTECLAAEWGRSGVRVNAVSPGYTRTLRVQKQIDDGHRDEASLVANSAMGRLVEPVEVAEAIAFLLSERSSAITGVNIPIDCGWLLAPSWQTYGGLRPGRTRG